MRDDHPATRMSAAATALLGTLTDGQRDRAARPWTDDRHRRWIEYRPRPRPGVSLAELAPHGRKAAHRLLATGLGGPAYAQAMTILALEEVLDRAEGWRRGRHSDDYRVVLFGEPGGTAPWTWRFEGHHLSVTMTVHGDRVFPTPVFLGANPARVSHGGVTVLRPLAPEEDVARELLDALGPAGRSRAVVSDTAPEDLRSSVLPRVPDGLGDPAGVPVASMGPGAQALAARLLAVYLERLPAELAAVEAARVDVAALHFAWEGPTRPASRHYYRLSGPDLLVEYDNTADDGSHAHTVLRRPWGDFGGADGTGAEGRTGGGAEDHADAEGGGGEAVPAAAPEDVLAAHRTARAHPKEGDSTASPGV